MGFLQKFEQRIEMIVGDGLAKVFGGKVQLQEVIFALRRQAREGTVQLSDNTYLTPYRYTVSISPEDRSGVLEKSNVSLQLASDLTSFIKDNGWVTAEPVTIFIQSHSMLHSGQFRVSSHDAQENYYPEENIENNAGYAYNNQNGSSHSEQNWGNDDWAYKSYNQQAYDNYQSYDNQANFSPSPSHHEREAKAPEITYDNNAAAANHAEPALSYNPPNEYEYAPSEDPDPVAQALPIAPEYQNSVNSFSAPAEDHDYNPTVSDEKNTLAPEAPFGSEANVAPSYPQPKIGTLQQSEYVPPEHIPPITTANATVTSVQLILDDDNGTTFSLQPGSNTIGRGQNADFKISDTGISRRHIDVIFNDDSVVVNDLDSTNGTIVNGLAVRSQQLANDDVIRIGHTNFVVKIVYS